MQSLIFTLGVLDNITKPIGKIFQPLLDFVASILAFFYSIIPNYPVSIALLTIVIMAILTPLTVKSTKSMAAMQALGPEMKKLQQKYKGAENRAQLNEEMMKLYKEHKVNPASGCLPMLLQLPAFLVLYDVIRGITNTVQVHGHTVAQPRYIPHNTAMYHDIIAGHGALNSFGMDFAKKLLPFSSHSSVWAALPYLFLVLASIALQYLQMSRLSKRNPAASANPQAAMLQKYMPIVFGLIYLNIPAAVNVYFIVSSAIRIGTQEVLFRRGIVGAP
ncbi:MAG TPA: YidC/Oxa1 family membrane protein insertase, partial [Acidimicrobiales bacterium]|nr:YidC/Oxa1 family membrane protein insertase [Acidimicrobiales bacterium]